jgi:ribonucleoside-diphosphate reductase alpha chain
MKIMKTNVIKRDGSIVPVKTDEILLRLQKLSSDNAYKNAKELMIDPLDILKKIINGLHNNITTQEIDILCANECMFRQLDNPDYIKLASRILIDNYKKNININLKQFSQKYNLEGHSFYLSCVIINKLTGMIPQHIMDFISKYTNELNAMIVPERDFKHDYFGFIKLDQIFLQKIKQDNKLMQVQSPQFLYLLVSIGLHLSYPNPNVKFPKKHSKYEKNNNIFDFFDDDKTFKEMCKHPKYNLVDNKKILRRINKIYDLFSTHKMIHATPILMNLGRKMFPHCSSCFILPVKGDSIKGIYSTLKKCALISKSCGGIGLSCHSIREFGSRISSTLGESSGIMTMLKTYNETAVYVNQGGKRKGAFAVYLEPWHPDFIKFLYGKNPIIGNEEEKARDLFYGIWMPSLFWEYCKNNDYWYFISPLVGRNLSELFGNDFKKRYEQLVVDGNYCDKIKARELLRLIIKSIGESGGPYILSKDEINKKNNQSNLGTIYSSNLCTEVTEYNDKYETAVCNLGSICVNKFIKKIHCGNKIIKKFDHKSFGKVVAIMVKNLNIIININNYPIKEAIRSNLRHRPIGIGIQGLANLFIKLGLPFDSKEAINLDKKIFETLYFNALKKSCKLAKQFGCYPSMNFGNKAPIAKGIFQFNLWETNDKTLKVPLAKKHNWDALKKDIIKYGIHNSLFVAPMPTTNTSVIFGNTECFEPIKSNIEKRRNDCGESLIINKYLIKDLIKEGIWEKVKYQLLIDSGSIQNIDIIPNKFKELYKTAWDIDPKIIIDHSAARGPFVDQSNSQNLYIKDFTPSNMTRILIYAYKKKIKTLSYYVHTKTEISSQTSNMKNSCSVNCYSCSS